MANQEQLAILKQGVEAWNWWREQNPDVKIDLREAILKGVDLSDANFSKANLRGANLELAKLWKAYLLRADLSKANLRDSNLIGANIGEANLHNADLRGANLEGAYLRKADLSGVNLSAANLRQASLRESNFLKAQVVGTFFGNLDLSLASELENIVHSGPSNISTDTLTLSKGKIPELFLRGCGLSDWEIESAKLYNPELDNEEINKILYKMYDLRATQALQIFPLFISYSHGDGTFVDKLENHLNKKGVRFWRDVHDMKAGRIEKQIDRAMRLNPTVLLILSEHSLKSDWVEHEVRTAREFEKEMGRDILCPIALDDRWKKSPWPKRVMEQVMEYNILDFSAWENDNKFGSTFNKLIDGLELFYKG